MPWLTTLAAMWLLIQEELGEFDGDYDEWSWTYRW